MPLKRKKKWGKALWAISKTVIKRQKRLRPRSKRMNARMAEYKKLMVEFLRLNPKCERCGNQTQSIHHSRGRIGSLLMDVRFFKSLCLTCHQWVENNPNEARAAGLLCQPGDWNRPEKNCKNSVVP